jgi:chaperonin 10 Kd subunit
MKFQPLGKRVLIEREEETKITASGIIIPDNASKEKPSIGKIVEIGKECEGVNIGDQVAFAKYSGSEITLGDKKYLILNLEDVLGVIKIK